MKLTYQLDNNAYPPRKSHSSDAGYDLFLKSNLTSLCIKPLETVTLDTGVHVLIPEGYVGKVYPRSSSSSQGLLIHTGIIDAGYTGSIKINVTFLGNEPGKIIMGAQRIAQLVIEKLPEFELEPGSVSSRKTERGSKGFGSSGM